MKDEFFFDTNVLAYVLDRGDEKRRKRSARLVGRVMFGEITGCVSNQILAELYSVLTGKMKETVSREEAEALIESIVQSEKWRKINYSHETVKRALRTAGKKKISIWDAIIIETMNENDVSKIFTEDVVFRRFPGIAAVNPFRG